MKKKRILALILALIVIAASIVLLVYGNQKYISADSASETEINAEASDNVTSDNEITDEDSSEEHSDNGETVTSEPNDVSVEIQEANSTAENS